MIGGWIKGFRNTFYRSDFLKYKGAVLFQVIVIFIALTLALANCSIGHGVVLAGPPPPPAIAYTRIAPPNVPPFAASINIFSRALSYPAVLPPVPVLRTPFPAPALPVAPPFPVLRSPVVPELLPAPVPAVGFRSAAPVPLFPAPAGVLPAPLWPQGRSIPAVAPAVLPQFAPALGGPVLAGPELRGPSVLGGPVLGGPELAGPGFRDPSVLSGPVLGGPALAGPAFPAPAPLWR